MKKIVLSIAALASFAIANAQDFKPTSGKVALEFNAASPFASSNTFSLPTYGFKARYFLSDQLAARLGFNWNSNSTKSPDNTYADLVDETSNSTFTFAPGFEKHFAGTDRLSPYIGAIIPLTFASSNQIAYSSVSSASSYRKTTVTNANGYTSFGLGILTGADFYITKSLYLGVEGSLVFTSINYKDKVTKVENTTGIGSNSDLTEEQGSAFNINSNANATFRIGYWF